MDMERWAAAWAVIIADRDGAEVAEAEEERTA